MTIRISFSDKTVRVAVEINGAIESAITELPQRPWVGLTPEEILYLFDVNNVYGSKWIEFARTVENKLKEKNT